MGQRLASRALLVIGAAGVLNLTSGSVRAQCFHGALVEQVWSGGAVTLTGANPDCGVALEYRWQRGGVDIADGPQPGGSVYTGSGTIALTITGVTLADHGPYELVLTGTCGVSVDSRRVYVSNSGGCDSIDLNADGIFPDVDDLQTLFCWFGQQGWDFNNDGIWPDALDIEAALSVFAGGECLR